MKVISKDQLIAGLVDHPPYDSNPALKAKLNILYISPDGRMAMAYYESDPGWFEEEVKDFDEIDYVLEGEVELISDDQHLIAKPGDCFLIENGDKFRWQMNKPSKMLFFIHSLSPDVQEFISQLAGATSEN
jgi:ethanolamine utilization protein EutQ (cupin superfamily)